MAELMQNVSSVESNAKNTQKTAARVRRKSREVEEMLATLPCAEKWKGLTTLLGEDKSEGAIEKLFKEIGTSATPCSCAPHLIDS